MSATQGFPSEDTSHKDKTPPKWWKMLVEGGYGNARVRRGDFFESTVLSMGDRTISVDLQGKRDGIIQERDLENVPDSYLEQVEVGDKIPVRVIKVPFRRSSVIVSLKQGIEQKDWIRAEKLMEEGNTVEVEITGTNRGGVLASFGGLNQGFIPNSHLLGVPRGVPKERRQELKQARVGTRATALIIEVDVRRRRLVLSERRAASRRRKEVLEELHEGVIRTGIVNNIVDFGAFIDLGGIDGLLHISEIAWEHIDHPRDVLTVGQEVEVYVLDVDRERERISLSRKRLLPDPWEEVTRTLHSGDTIVGRITHLADFGAFVDVGNGVEGLVHVSEMPNDQQTLSSLFPDTLAKVKVLHIDPLRQRISLRLEENVVEEDTTDFDETESEPVAAASATDLTDDDTEAIPDGEPEAELDEELEVSAT